MSININLFAIALFEAVEDRSPYSYLEKFDQFIELLESDKEIENFVLKSYDNFDILKDDFLKLFKQEFTNFLKVLYEQRRLKDIKEIRAQYANILMEKKMLSLIDIYSESKLSESTLNKILLMLEDKYLKPYRINLHVDKSLLGGYVLKVNSDIYDSSFKSKLMKIQKLEVE